jgi:multiple inositol-polyphosphate phosphatase / 2,3-bisphosphoglycerate 3-phosphatase
MIKRKVSAMAWIFICLFVTGVRVKAQTGPLYLGTKTPYQAPAGLYTAAPAGYKPVFVNYAGRHGARFLTKAGADVHVLKVLKLAVQRNGLREYGKRIMAVAEQLLAASQHNYEHITLSGAGEQEAIGGRLLKNFPSVFTGKGLVIETTYKVRTQQSAEAFLRAFSTYSGKKLLVQAPDSTDTRLRFYDLSPGYLEYKRSDMLRRSLDSLDKDGRTREVAVRICSKVFNPVFAESLLKNGEALDFAENLYDLYAIKFSMTAEMKAKGYVEDNAAWAGVLERGDLEWFDFRSGAADFLEKGPGFDSLGIQVRVAVPLLVDFINSMDAVIGRRSAGQGLSGDESAGRRSEDDNLVDSAKGELSDGDADAVLRFTHAEAISPMAALMGIEHASEPVSSVYRYHAGWQAESVIPLSANIQWVLYTDGKNYLVKVLLNEREVRLPLVSAGGPYYRWEDVRKYYLDKLKGLGTGLKEDMLGYLRGLK